MAFKFIGDNFSISRDSNHFVQLKTLKNPNSSDVIWLAIEIVGDSRYARSTAQSIIDTIDETYFEASDLDAYSRFEDALKEVNIIINSIKERRKKTFGDINAIIAISSNGELHLTQSKTAEAYLIRKNRFSMISEGLSSRAKDLFVNIASGEILPDDKLIFSTSRLLRLATHSQLVQLFSDGVAEATDAMKELVSQDESLSLGVMNLHVKPAYQSAEVPVQKRHSKWLLQIKNWLNIGVDQVASKVDLKRYGVEKQTVLAVIAALAILLFLSVSFLMTNRRNQAIREEYRIKIEALNEDLNVASTKGYANDKESANAILEKVEGEARSILETSYFRAEALDLLDKAQVAKDNINNTDRLRKLAPYVDLAAKRAEVSASGMVNLDDNFFVYEFNRFYEVILNQVLEPRLIDEDEAVIASSAMQDQGVIVFLTQSGRVIEYENGQIRFANTNDQTWKSGVDVQAYGRNIYILSPEENQIYKYSRSRSSYSNGSAYSKGADLSGALSIAIDGSVYVLKEGGDIIRLFKGKQEQFRIEDLAVDLSGVTQIFTALELDNIYLLDPPNKRVVILTKSNSGISRYYGQVVFEDLENLKEIYVEKGENKLHVLTDKEIYKVDI